jgi:hypothetical protein
VGISPTIAGSGKGTRGAKVVVGRIDLDLAREQAGSGREAGNSTFMAVADGTKKSRAEVGGSGSAGVEAQRSEWVKCGGSDRGSAGGDIWLGWC